MAKAAILLLNGTSSSGKSSIAKVLQTMIDVPCFHLCIDDYLGALQKDLWDRPEMVRREWLHIIRGFHAAAAAIARAGNLVIVDDVLENEPPWVENLLALFEDLDVLIVGVHCPLAELERREQARGDRKQGMARLQFDQVHTQALYDVEVDTSKLSPQACATRIMGSIEARQSPLAFEKLRERFLTSPQAP